MKLIKKFFKKPKEERYKNEHFYFKNGNNDTKENDKLFFDFLLKIYNLFGNIYKNIDILFLKGKKKKLSKNLVEKFLSEVDRDLFYYSKFYAGLSPKESNETELNKKQYTIYMLTMLLFLVNYCESVFSHFEKTTNNKISIKKEAYNSVVISYLEEVSRFFLFASLFTGGDYLFCKQISLKSESDKQSIVEKHKGFLINLNILTDKVNQNFLEWIRNSNV